MSEVDFLPWQHDQWAQLREARAAGRLPHALLLRGPHGTGKRHFARALALRLLCERDEEAPCGVCRGCELARAGNHPDFYDVAVQEDRKVILVEQIRELIARLMLAAQMGGAKVAVIAPAEAMNPNAQNSLLKTLEEAPRETTLILASSLWSRLAPTIVSRCQSLRFPCPDAADAQRWLETHDAGGDWDVLLRLANGAPLGALALAAGEGAKQDQKRAQDLVGLMRAQQDPVSVAEHWGKDSAASHEWLHQQVGALLRWKLTGAPGAALHKVLHRHLQKDIATLSVTSLYRHLDALGASLRQAELPVNQVLALATLLTEWVDGPPCDIPVNERNR